jgi:hypothetical protein
MSWFLESWAVPEGCAFAAHRNYSELDTSGLREYLDPPDQVLYVCPPDFTPTPVRYATALAAARGRFQEKFTDPSGREVAFETLEELIELVRRAYLAAGAGGSPPPPDAPKPKDPDDSDDERDENIEKKWVEAARLLTAGITRQEKDATAHYLSSIWSPYASRRLIKFCGDIIEALARESRLRTRDLLFERDLRDLTLVSLEINDWPSWNDSDKFLGKALHDHWNQIHGPLGGSGPPGWWWCATSTDGLSSSLASGLLYRLPSPYAWAPYQNLVRLGDHLSAATADRGYLKSIGSFDRFLPLLTCCLALAAAESYRFRAGGPFRDAALVRARAFKWLAMESPDARLDGQPMAGTAIVQVLSKATSATARSTL